MASRQLDDPFWLEFAGRSGLGDTQNRSKLLVEAGELLAIFAASQLTAKYGRR
jgi:hypothetical protein